MVVEMGAKNGVVTPDPNTATYLKERGLSHYKFVKGDTDAHYEKTIEYDASLIPPLVACPYTVDNVKPVSEVDSVAIDQALIGSCTNGRLEDLRAAAKILLNKRVKRGVRMLVIPASQEVYNESMREGLLETFSRAGALICNPACGPCFGGHLGLLSKGEVCISTTNRNFVGRMGSPHAKIYLASPATVAASAIIGKISDPRAIR
jgi:homoaconitase/3-isopropylmalate dehydratase large subunit